jgi:hypothetical protein
MLALAQEKTVRVIAFYLPQFHPIPENDDWWGRGFTEWTNVARSRPSFPGHYQPHIDLGFYDLRLPEAREAQADLARQYGIDGFCYYHYWFNGKRLLQRPFDEVLSSGRPSLPFCLCWANESWTRRWDGHDEHILIEQKHCEADDREHIRWLADAFHDSRYIEVDGKPLLLVYRANRMPNPARTTSIWREQARRMGVGDIFLCKVESFADPARIGFDAAVEFQPDWAHLGVPFHRRGNRVYKYSSMVERALRRDTPSYRRFPCVTPSWDNSARRKEGATIFTGSTPGLYERWLGTALRKESDGNGGERVIFINAWNEWGEGNHLEPCRKWGRAFLEATLRAVTGIREGGQLAAEADEGALDAEEEEGLYGAYIRAAHADALDALHRIQEELADSVADLEAGAAEMRRWEPLYRALEEIVAVVPRGSTCILVDNGEWGEPSVDGRHALPFLERDGQYWGPPPDDEAGIRELERLRAAGASHIVFAWPAFWWLEHYGAFHRHLRSRFRCVLENDRLVAFDLRSGGSDTA